MTMATALICAALAFASVCIGVAMCAYGAPRGRNPNWFAGGVFILFGGLVAFGVSVGAML